MSELLLHVTPECPLCHVHHPQSFTKNDLSQLLERGELTLFCPRLEMSWPAPPEQCEELARQVESASFQSTACSTGRKRRRSGAASNLDEQAIQQAVSAISHLPQSGRRVT
jgi:hypothetical protein